MNVKKKWSILLLCFLLIFVQIPPALAQVQSQEIQNVKVIKEYKEITDPNELLERAKKNVTDVANPPEFIENIMPQSTSINCKSKIETKNQVYKTTQLLKIAEEDGVPTRYYATTAIGVMMSGTKTVDSKNDPELATGSDGSVVAYVTIYFKEVTSPAPRNNVHTQVYKTTGYWRPSSGFTISNGAAYAKSIGFSDYSGDPWKSSLSYTVPSSKLISGFTWSYTNLRPIIVGTAVWNAGSYTKIRITRGSGGGSWDMYMSNSLAGTNMIP